MADLVFQVGAGRDFCLFGDEGMYLPDGQINMEPVTEIVPIEISKSSAFASQAWSCNCDWYFICLPDGLALLNVYSNRGFICKEKSGRFIELFLDAPMKRAGRKKAQ